MSVRDEYVSRLRCCYCGKPISESDDNAGAFVTIDDDKVAHGNCHEAAIYEEASHGDEFEFNDVCMTPEGDLVI